MFLSPLQTTSGDVGLAVAFWVLSISAVASALAVVLVRNLFRSAIFLVMSFFAIAGLYVTLQADFVAAIQVLIYAGAISILLIFAVLFTRDVEHGSGFNKITFVSFLLAALIFTSLVVAALNTDWAISNQSPPATTTAGLADALFNRYVLPFEIAGALLLAAVIGAIALVRER